MSQDVRDATRSPNSLQTRRLATVYDAVAGRVGLNGFLTREQMASERWMASRPEEVLLRRVRAPDQIPYDFYAADEKLEPSDELPDSDLLKAIHTRVSDLYAALPDGEGAISYRSLDETALLSLAVLLEEASKEALGSAGDMVLTEPEGLEFGLPLSALNKYQIRGRVKLPEQSLRVPPSGTSDVESDELEQEASPRKRRRR